MRNHLVWYTSARTSSSIDAFYRRGAVREYQVADGFPHGSKCLNQSKISGLWGEALSLPGAGPLSPVCNGQVKSSGVLEFFGIKLGYASREAQRGGALQSRRAWE